MNKQCINNDLYTMKSELTGELSLRSARSFLKDELIASHESKTVLQVPNYRTVQVGHDTHVDYLDELVFLNHSCAPNTYIVITGNTLFLKAMLPIAAHDELTYFYPSTEWEMANPFRCYCQSAGCLEWISGARFLPPQVLRSYIVSGYIQSMVASLPVVDQ